VLKRFDRRDEAREIFEDKWTVSEKIEHLMRLTAERTRLKFSELFEGVTSRSEVVCTFLALLELIRLKQLVCAQSEAFGEIEIGRAATPAPVPVPTAGANVPGALAGHISDSIALAVGGGETVSQGENHRPSN
jgi:segregation and condensation protein A